MVDTKSLDEKKAILSELNSKYEILEKLNRSLNGKNLMVSVTYHENDKPMAVEFHAGLAVKLTPTPSDIVKFIQSQVASDAVALEEKLHLKSLGEEVAL